MLCPPSHVRYYSSSNVDPKGTKYNETVRVRIPDAIQYIPFRFSPADPKQQSLFLKKKKPRIPTSRFVLWNTYGTGLETMFDLNQYARRCLQKKTALSCCDLESNWHDRDESEDKRMKARKDA